MTNFTHQQGSTIALKHSVDSFVIQGEKPLFVKVFIGLIFNIIHRTSSPISLNLEQHKDRCLITVCDEGEGISSKELQNIEEVFANPEPLSDIRKGITSVNFAEIALFTHRLNGTIKIDSNGKTGTTVSLSFKSAEKNCLSQNTLSSSSKSSSQKTLLWENNAPILVVDDEPINLKIVTAFLEYEHYPVVVAKDGKETLDILSKMTPALILMDVMLPDTSGIELVREIRKKYDSLILPILFVSAKSDPDTLQNSYASGGNGFIVKPIDRSALMLEVQMWIRLSILHRSKEGKV
jgi:CheY-like chemotaxis protein